MRGNEDEDVEELTMSDGEGGEEEIKRDSTSGISWAYIQVYL